MSASVQEEFVPIPDRVAKQTGGDVIESAYKVRGTIKKAEIRTEKDRETGLWTTRKLSLDVEVGPLGVDGSGKYARKHFFPKLLVDFNDQDFPQRFAKSWWHEKATFPLKQFLLASGRAHLENGQFTQDIPGFGADELAAFSGTDIIFDIRKSEISRKNPESGQYVGTGEFQNELQNFRKAD